MASTTMTFVIDGRCARKPSDWPKDKMKIAAAASTAKLDFILQLGNALYKIQMAPRDKDLSTTQLQTVLENYNREQHGLHHKTSWTPRRTRRCRSRPKPEGRSCIRHHPARQDHRHAVPPGSAVQKPLSSRGSGKPRRPPRSHKSRHFS